MLISFKYPTLLRKFTLRICTPQENISHCSDLCPTRWYFSTVENLHLARSLEFGTHHQRKQPRQDKKMVVKWTPKWVPTITAVYTAERTEPAEPAGQPGPWMVLATQKDGEKRREDKKRVQWEDCTGIKADWANSQSFALPVSFGCGEVEEKSVRFSSPLELEQPESRFPKKKTAREAIKGLMRTVKEKLVAGGDLRHWGDTTLVSTVDNAWEFFPHNFLP